MGCQRLGSLHGPWQDAIQMAAFRLGLLGAASRRPVPCSTGYGSAEEGGHPPGTGGAASGGAGGTAGTARRRGTGRRRRHGRGRRGMRQRPEERQRQRLRADCKMSCHAAADCDDAERATAARAASRCSRPKLSSGHGTCRDHLQAEWHCKAAVARSRCAATERSSLRRL